MKLIDRAFVTFQYALAFWMLWAGIITVLVEPEITGAEEVLVHRSVYLAFGTLYFISGAVLLFGRMRHNPKFVQYGLMTIYLAALFSGFTSWYVRGFSDSIISFLFAALVAAAYLYRKRRRRFLDKRIQAG